MRDIPSKFALSAIFALAITFTFSCSGGGGDDDGGTSSNGGTSSPSSGVGNNKCTDIANCKKKQIGSQNWLAENLNIDVSGSVCYDNKESNCNTYGRLYTWEAAMSACPNGWHLPDTTEWNALVTSVGGSSTAGKHLKAKEGWNSCGPTGSGESYSCEDTYGFSALPGGYGNSSGDFYDVGNDGNWWSASEYSSSGADLRYMSYDDEYVYYGNFDKDYLFSVRCVQD